MDREERPESEAESFSLDFDPDDMTEDDIGRIWERMKRQSAKEKKIRRKIELNLCSTDTTPTTDYNDTRFTIPSEDLKQITTMDKHQAKTSEILQLKRNKLKTYLTQVILYDNVSHDRLLQQKLGNLQNRHRVVEKRIKRRKEVFVRNLENKQNEWTRLDARASNKLEPEVLPDLSFKFGRLYHSADYPYQAAIQTLRGLRPPKPKDARKPIVLPQITRKRARRASATSEASKSDEIFVTKLPKGREPKATNAELVAEKNVKPQKQKPSWNRDNREEPKQRAIEIKLPPLRDTGRGGRRAKGAAKNWLEDERYVTLTSLLGPCFSPSKKLRSRKHKNNMLTSGIVLQAAYW